jgi:hypothetical protein
MKRTLSSSDPRNVAPIVQTAPGLAAPRAGAVPCPLSPELWSEYLGKHDAVTVIELIQQQDPAERVINLKNQNLDGQQVGRLAEVVAHAQCPPFALNLEGATAATIREVFVCANRHKPLTKLNLGYFAVIRVVDSTPKRFSITAEHLDLIAKMLGPASQLDELVLDGQWLLPADVEDGCLSRPLLSNQRQQSLDELLAAIGASRSMKTLSLMGCDLFHEDLPIIGKKLFAQEAPCALISLRLSNNFQEKLALRSILSGALATTEFLTLAAGARCLESLDLGQFVLRDDTFDAGLLALLRAVKTLCVVLPCPDGEAGLPLQIRQQLGANRRARTASVCEMALCVRPYHLSSRLVEVLADKMLTIEQEAVRSN